MHMLEALVPEEQGYELYLLPDFPVKQQNSQVTNGKLV